VSNDLGGFLFSFLADWCAISAWYYCVGHGRQEMKYRVRRQDDYGNVFTVPPEGVRYEHLAESVAVKQIGG
jgi:hypothetical protein